MKRDIPTHNYLIVAIIIIVSVLITIYIMNLVRTFRETSYDQSVFSDNINEVFLNELSEAISETNQVILYISYTKSADISKMEDKLLDSINDKGLNDHIIYVNVTDYIKDAEYINILKKEFPNIETQINSAPLFIYIKNGEAIEAFSSELKMIDYKMLEKIVSKYEIGI